MNRPDVIVIGGGIGGLVAAGLLAHKGKEVLLIEKQARVGGFVTGFTRDGYYFDAACAFVSACTPGAELYNILSELGVIDDITFLPIKDVWNIYPNFDLRINYQDPAAYLESVRVRFHEFSDGFSGYETLTNQLGREFVAFEQAPLWKKLLLPFSFPILFRYARKSHADILERFFGNDPDITLALSALPTALPPSRLSYTFVAVLWAKVLKSGVFYPKGGMRALTKAIDKGIRRLGVNISCGLEVIRVITRGERAVGVTLSNGQEVYSDWVISNGNPFLMQGFLPDRLHLYGRLHRLERYRLSLSAVLFYVKLHKEALPPNWPYFVSITTATDLEAMHGALEAGSMEQGLHMVITTPSLLDQTLAPPGYHSLKVLVHAPRADLFARNYGFDSSFNRLQKQVFSKIHKLSGLDLATHAFFVERATPNTLMRMTGNQQGAMYGLDAACGQVGPQRPPNRTAIKNLLWAGHYTHPAHGIVGSAMSGSFASKIVLSDSK
ncbi:putative All-trans-retinol 13,14-reductase [uncultured Desulfobacterium sp.]|uniref:Putative All-trans-retinol 13,14-reductase n=1 Tax=uncultured Desulfobacterium sp. TaxID=201089 RepID=A0A445MZH3_9BACT|nr:putative All-trans-retinol 13,14-reductase [uncultured Desulfobacterium sp.]